MNNRGGVGGITTLTASRRLQMGERAVIPYVSSLFVLVICLDYGGKNSTHD